MTRLLAAVTAATLALAAPAAAETAFEVAFRTGTLDALDVGDRLSYVSRLDDAAQPEASGGDTTIAVELTDDGAASLTEHDDAGRDRVLGRFDAGVGNPLAMYFLERTIRSVATGTGGSDVYLRNRIKDALREPETMREIEIDWNGRTVGATEIVLAPFEGDANLARLGHFGDLRIRLVVGETVPGFYHTLSADAGNGAYASALTLGEVSR